jgi:hypothetical protein
MASPRVLQAQLQDLLDATQHDSRFEAVAVALQGALDAVPGSGDDADETMSPGRKAARREDPEPERQRPVSREDADPGANQPKSFADAREAAEARFAQAGTE